MQKVLPLRPGVYYHIFDRGINGENIFREERNYAYFLNHYFRYITPVAETYAYCLLRNHFHLLVRIRPQTASVSETNAHGGTIETDAVLATNAHVGAIKTASVSVSPTLASKAFNNFLTAYAKGMNKTYGRTGALFQHHFGRIPVTSGRYLAAVVRYIHRNPLKHGFVEDFREWPYSSHHMLLSHELTCLARTAVHDWFGGTQGMRKFHSVEQEEPGLERLLGTDLD